MAKGNQKFFTKRGERDTTINLYDEDINIKIIIPTNKQHDQILEKYTHVSQDGTVDIQGADLLEDRLTNYIVSLPFDVPYDEDMNTFGSWDDASDDQKKIAVSMMDPKLRDEINNRISGEEELSSETVGN